MTTKYDLFILHSSKNEEEAKKLMEDIEKFHKPVKCCFADRDFVPGKTHVENISNATESSNAIVMLISRHFERSRHCWHGEQEAFRKYTQEKRNCIIPVKLEDVEMPKSLRNMTYVDFQKDSDPAGKICKAYKYYLHPALEIEEHCRKSLDSYDDSFEDAEERLEFLRDEVDEETLQNYFDEAAKRKDLNLLRCILNNNHTKLTANNMLTFCRHVPKDGIDEELVESVFQKLPCDLSLADYKESYTFVCLSDKSCLVRKFNTLGCQSLIDASFVCKILPTRHLESKEKNAVVMDILKDKKWKDDELQSFLDVAIERRNLNTTKVLLSLVSTIPFQKFSLLIFEMDEETCIQVFRREKYQDGEHLLVNALQRACLKNMKTLVKEILKQGLQLQPKVLLPDYDFGIVEILIKEYPWCLQELHDLQKILTKPVCRRLLQSEIQKKTGNS